MKQIEDGLWLAQADMEAGSFKRREGTLKEFSTDYEKVMSSYIDQMLAKTYLKNLKPDNSFQEATLGYSRAVSEAIKAGENPKNIEVPNFIEAGKKSFENKGKIDFRLKEGVWRGIDNVMKNVGGSLESTFSKLRDVTTTKDYRQAIKDGNLSLTRRLKAKALQDFIEDVSSYEYKDGRLKEYLNDYIADQVSLRQAENSFFDKITNKILTTFARAQLGGNLKTVSSQILESTRLPAYFSMDEIKNGTKAMVTDHKRIVDDYALKEFSPSLDKDRIRTELEYAKAQSGEKFDVKKLMDDILFKPLEKSELEKNVLVASVAENAGKAKGLKGDALTRYVRDMVFRVGNVGGEYTRPPIFDSNAARLLLQYSGYSIRNTANLVDHFRSGETNKAFGMLASQAVNAALLTAVTGLPLKYALGNFMPLGLGPAVAIAEDVYNTITSDWSKESKKGKLKRIALRNLMPGGTQLNKTQEGLQASKGYDQTYSGRVRVYGEKEGPLNTARAAVFGKTALPDVGRSYEEKNYGLSDKQSAAFNQMTPEQKERFVAGQVKLQDIRRGEEEPGFFKKLFSNEDKKPIDVEKVSLDQIKERIKEKDPTLTKEELVSYYMRDIDTKTDSLYKTKKVEKKIFSRLAGVMNSEVLSEEQKDQVINSMLKNTGETREDFDYYHVANDTTDEKVAYVMDEIAKIAKTSKDRGQLLKFLAESRKSVNGKILASQGVLKALLDKNLISRAEYQKLNNFKYSGSGAKVKTKTSGRGNGATLKKIKAFNPPEAKAIKLKARAINGGVKAVKAPKIKMPEINPSSTNVKLKDLNYTSKPIAAVANIKGRRFRI